MLSQIADIRAGYPFRAGIEAHADGSVLAVQMRDIRPEGGMEWADVVRTEVDARSGADWLRDGDILFVAKGARYFATCLSGVPERTVSSPHLYVLRIRNPVSLLPEFLAWQINQAPARQYLADAAVGTNQRSIRREALEKLPIIVPSVDRQHHILVFAGLALAERNALEKLIKNRQQQLNAIARDLLLASKAETTGRQS